MLAAGDSCRPGLATLVYVEFCNRPFRYFSVGMSGGGFKIFRREGDFKK
jgi:hypothetical protein